LILKFGFEQLRFLAFFLYQGYNMKTVIINMAPHLPMEGRKNTPYTIEESGTLSHPDAGLNEESLENSSN
jgi:hypothetical protein